MGMDRRHAGATRYRRQRDRAGAGVAALGLLLVLDVFSGADIAVVGVLWALVAMTGAASYFLLGADTTADVPPLGLAGCSLAVGAVGLALLGATGLMPLRAATSAPDYAGTAAAWWVPILALGVVTAGLAYCAGIAAIRRLGSRVASFVGLLEAVAGVVFAWLLLDQVPDVVQVVGGGLVLTGVVLVKVGERVTALAPVLSDGVLMIPDQGIDDESVCGRSDGSDRKAARAAAGGRGSRGPRHDAQRVEAGAAL
jgi:drug/metabolite transporter (DMT)-like permease